MNWLIKTVNAQSGTIGKVAPPPGLDRFGEGPTSGGIGILLTMFIRILIIGAGVYALFNFILAGYSFMSSDGDPGKVAASWNKITQTIIGLVVAAGSIVLAAIISRLIYGDYSTIISPTIAL